MSLTTAQLATLKTDALSQSVLTAPIAASDWATCAGYYNNNSTRNVWIPNLARSVVNAATNWVAFVAKTTQQQQTYMAMLSDPVIDATNLNIRNGFQAIFSGADVAALSNAAQRVGTRLEVLLFTSQGPPDVSAVFGYILTAQEMQKAMI